MGEPKQAMVTWLPVTPHGEGDPGRTPCDAYRVGFGELEVLYANDAPDITRASYLVIGANVTPAAAAKTESMLEPPRALPNGWSERVSRKDPTLSLFTQPNRPWLCASGAAVRGQLRALLARDPQLPILVGLPLDVLHATFSVGDAAVSGTAQWGFTLIQLDRDARQHMAEVSCSRQLPRGFQLFVQNRTHYGSAAAAQAAFFKVGPPSEQTLLGPDTFDRDVVRVR